MSARAFLPVAFGFVVAAATAAPAQTAYGPRIVHLSVLDRETGQDKPVYLHQRRYFVAAQTGGRYALRVENVTAERVMVVLSVDGVNVVSGETADTSQRGYILSPYQTADISGWRKSQTEIAAFRFAPLSQSYAARTGRPVEVGVIGMAVFRERTPPPPPMFTPDDDRIARRGSQPAAPPPPPPPPPPPAPIAAPAPPAPVSPSTRMAESRARAPAVREKLGTAHGEIEYSVSYVAPFERATFTPESVRVIEYDSTANLIAAGVIPRRTQYPRRPQPFPGDHDGRGYVPDPPSGAGGLD